MFKDMINRVKKKGVNIWVKIPLTKPIPMDHERQPGDFVCAAVEVAVLKAVLRRYVKLVDNIVANGVDETTEETIEKYRKEVADRAGKF